jgi:hypothetical protein
VLNDPSYGIATVMCKKLQSNGLDLSDDTIMRSLQRQGL